MQNRQSVTTQYLTWMRESRGASPSTLASYTETLAKLSGWCEPASASTADLEGFVLRPRRNGEVGAPATRTREIVCLRSFYLWAAGRGHVPRNPALELQAPKVPARQPKPISDGIWSSIWQRELSDIDRVVLGLGAFLGLRRAEIAALSPLNLDLTSRVLRSFKRKGGGDDHMAYGPVLEVWAKRLPQLQVESFEPALKRVVTRDTPYVLYGYRWPRTAEGSATPASVTNRVATISNGAFTAHQLRHSFVTNLLRAGLPLHMVSKLANHASPNTTMGYCRVAGQDVLEWLARN